MAHGDPVRKVAVYRPNGDFHKWGTAYEINIASAATVASLLATPGANKIRRIVGGFVTADAAADLQFVRDDGTTALSGLFAASAGTTLAFDFGDNLESAVNEPIKVTRSSATALKGEIVAVDIEVST